MCYSLSPYAGKEIVKIAYMVTGFGMWDICHIANLTITTYTTYSQNNTNMTKSRMARVGDAFVKIKSTLQNCPFI